MGMRVPGRGARRGRERQDVRRVMVGGDVGGGDGGGGSEELLGWVKNFLTSSES